MRLIAIAACLTGAIAGTSTSATTSPRPTAAHDRSFDALTTRAASGDTPSLHTLAAMRRHTDGARAEAIDKALSDALMTAPAVVLRLVRTQPGLATIDWYCQDRAIEPSAAEVRHYDVRATAALRQVGDPALREMRDRCLADIRKDV